MDASKIVSAIGAIVSVLTAVLAVPGFVPASWAPWIVLASGVLSAVGKRVIEVQALDNAKLTIALIVVTVAAVLAGPLAADVLPASWSTFFAGISATVLAFARSVFGWSEPDAPTE